MVNIAINTAFLAIPAMPLIAITQSQTSWYSTTLLTGMTLVAAASGKVTAHIRGRVAAAL